MCGSLSSTGDSFGAEGTSICEFVAPGAGGGTVTFPDMNGASAGAIDFAVGDRADNASLPAILLGSGGGMISPSEAGGRAPGVVDCGG